MHAKKVVSALAVGTRQRPRKRVRFATPETERGTGRSAATSTGGTLNKLEGRVGDSPILGAGCWADGHVAVSCTGQGEFFLRQATAKDISARMAYGGQTLAEAAAGAIGDVGSLGGEGGVICVDRDGNLAQPFNSPGMKRAAVYPGGRITVEVD